MAGPSTGFSPGESVQSSLAITSSSGPTIPTEPQPKVQRVVAAPAVQQASSGGLAAPPVVVDLTVGGPGVDMMSITSSVRSQSS